MAVYRRNIRIYRRKRRLRDQPQAIGKTGQRFAYFASLAKLLQSKFRLFIRRSGSISLTGQAKDDSPIQPPAIRLSVSRNHIRLRKFSDARRQSVSTAEELFHLRQRTIAVHSQRTHSAERRHHMGRQRWQHHLLAARVKRALYCAASTAGGFNFSVNLLWHAERANAYYQRMHYPDQRRAFVYDKQHSQSYGSQRTRVFVAQFIPPDDRYQRSHGKPVRRR